MIKFWHKHLFLPRSLALVPCTGRPPALPTRPFPNPAESRARTPGVKALRLSRNPRNPLAILIVTTALPADQACKSQAEPSPQDCRMCTGNRWGPDKEGCLKEQVSTTPDRSALPRRGTEGVRPPILSICGGGGGAPRNRVCAHVSPRFDARVPATAALSGTPRAKPGPQLGAIVKVTFRAGAAR